MVIEDDINYLLTFFINFFHKLFEIFFSMGARELYVAIILGIIV
jgi:hypothetical protein